MKYIISILILSIVGISSVSAGAVSCDDYMRTHKDQMTKAQAIRFVRAYAIDRKYFSEKYQCVYPKRSSSR